MRMGVAGDAGSDIPEPKLERLNAATVVNPSSTVLVAACILLRLLIKLYYLDREQEVKSVCHADIAIALSVCFGTRR
jgi:hypothetical protein